MAWAYKSCQLIVMEESFSEIELRRLDLNLLLVFSAMMREGSVNRAAGKLYLGPSAVSMALSRLREALNDPLFVREANRMVPTPRAEAFWARVEPALDAIAAAARADRFDPATAEMTIRFAAPDDLEGALLPALLARLDAAAPGIRLTARPADHLGLPGRLDAGDADLGLSALPPRLEARHRARILRRETFSVLYDAAQMGVTGPLDIDTYLDAPHLLRSVSGNATGPIDEVLRSLGRSRRVLAALSQFSTMPHVLKARRSVANVPALVAGWFARRFELECAPLPFPSPSFDLALVWSARLDADPAHIWFRDLVAEMVAELDRPAEAR
ncbi:MAG: LysR family transcriptional regulator [Pseudomonadota bacterium]